MSGDEKIRVVAHDKIKEVQRLTTKVSSTFCYTECCNSKTVTSCIAIHRAIQRVWTESHHKYDAKSLRIIKCDIKRSVFSCLSENIWSCYFTFFVRVGSPLLLSSCVSLTHVTQWMGYFLPQCRHKDAGNYVARRYFTVRMIKSQISVRP